MKNLRAILLSWPFLVLVAYVVLGLAFVGLGYIGSAGGTYLAPAVVVALALFWSRDSGSSRS